MVQLIFVLAFELTIIGFLWYLQYINRIRWNYDEKIISLLLAASLLFVFAACGKEPAKDAEGTTAADTAAGDILSETETDEDGSVIAPEVTTADSADTISTTDVTGAEATSVTGAGEASTVKPAAGAAADYLGEEVDFGIRRFDFSKVDADPSKWTMQQIVDCYKSGMVMEDNSEVETDQKFELLGDLPGVLDGPVKLAMKLAAQPYNALTGGYWAITPDDLKKADAHREGDYIIINLYPKDQTDGPNGDEHEGTVGHVVNVVQGIDDFIGFVEKNFAILNAKYDDDSVVLKYSNAYAKNVRINTKTGKMESGTWGYIIDVYLDHCSMAGVDFDNFHTTIGWTCWYPVK